MNNKQRLQRTLKKVLDKKQNTTQEIPGLLGSIVRGREQAKVKGRKSFVYVRLYGNQSETIQAFNDTVSVLYGMPVVVAKIKGKGYHYRVIGKNIGRYENWGGSNGWAQLAPHGNQHSFGIGAGGSDIVWVFKKQFIPLLPHPNSGTSIRVESDWYQWGNTYQHFTGSTFDLASAIPGIAGDARFVTLYLEGSSNSVKGVTGSLFSTSPFPSDITPYINVCSPSEGIPLTAVLLTHDTTNIAWNNLYDDVRPIYGVGGSEDSVLTIRGQGIPKCTGTSAIDFGEGFDVTSSGTVAYIAAPIVSGTVAYITTPIVSGTSTYVRAGAPTNLTGLTGTYWKIPDEIYASGTLSIFINGVAQTPITNYTEQYPASGTYQLTDMPPTGSVFTAIWGVPGINLINTPSYTSTYIRAGAPTNLAGLTGTYWKITEGTYATGTLSLFVNGVAQTPITDYAEQYSGSGTFQFTSMPPTGSVFTAIWGVPVQDNCFNSNVFGTALGLSKVLLYDSFPSGTSTVTFSSISQDYNDLEIVINGRSTKADDTDASILIAINGDTTDANYRRSLINGYATTITKSQADDRIVAYLSAASAPANSAGSFTMKILDYTNTTFNKHIQTIGSMRFDNDNLYEVLQYFGTEWESTAAITSISLVVESAYVFGSRIRLYGLL